MLETENGFARNTDERGTLFVFDLSQEIEQLAIVGARCLRADDGFLNRIEHAMHASGEYPPGEPKRRWRHGKVPYIVALEREVASYGWVTHEPEPMDDLGISFTPPTGDVWLYDFATVPEFRGRRFYPALLRFILSELKQQDVKRAWIGTEPGNLASQAGIRRAGFQLAAEMSFVGRPGQGHFVIYPAKDASEALVLDSLHTLHGRLAE